jgi:hypothetical protein
MRLSEKDESEETFRRGYEHGAVETFHAIEHFLDPSIRQVMREWIQKDVYGWRMNSMLGYPPTWRIRMLVPGKSALSEPLFP